MTSVLAHTVAQPTKRIFLPKNLSQLVIFVTELDHELTKITKILFSKSIFYVSLLDSNQL
jgi:hypothetical protein